MADGTQTYLKYILSSKKIRLKIYSDSQRHTQSMERYRQEHTLLLKGEKTVKNRGSASNEHKYQYLQSRKACLESLESITAVGGSFLYRVSIRL